VKKIFLKNAGNGRFVPKKKNIHSAFLGKYGISGWFHKKKEAKNCSKSIV
jgi:hypothetical protein